MCLKFLMDLNSYFLDHLYVLFSKIQPEGPNDLFNNKKILIIKYFKTIINYPHDINLLNLSKITIKKVNLKKFEFINLKIIPGLIFH